MEIQVFGRLLNTENPSIRLSFLYFLFYRHYYDLHYILEPPSYKLNKKIAVKFTFTAIY